MIAKSGIFHIELTKPLLEPQVSVGPVVSTESSNTIGPFSPHSLFLQQVPHRERVASSAWIKWGYFTNDLILQDTVYRSEWFALPRWLFRLLLSSRLPYQPCHLKIVAISMRGWFIMP